MADEDDVGFLQDEDWQVNPLQSDYQMALPPPDINPMAYSKYPLERLVQAAYDGDLELLEKMLDREDPINGYHHDINSHHQEINALHAAAMNGQYEAVDLLLKAGADPHIQQSMPYGRDPRDGETAREMADKWGWDDVVALLKNAEQNTPKGVYMRYGTGNNAKLWPVDRPEGLDPEQEKRAKRKHKSLARPLPDRGERKFYGDLVFGVTHGWDESGNVIKRPSAYGSGPMTNGGGDFGGGGGGGGGAIGALGPPSAAAGEGGAGAPPAAPRTTVGLLFPGQGSQYVKMMSTMQHHPKVQEMLASAKEILGYDLLKICLEGPESLLEQTEYCQPAIYVASLAAVERLREARPEAVESPGAVAGLSLGEYTALTVAGVMDFETGLKLVKQRSAAMAEASKSPPQAMMSVAGLEKEKLEKLCEQASAKTGKICKIANELFPKGYTCSGEASTVQVLKTLADEAQALQAKILKTSGAFHTPYMNSAKDALESALLAALPKMRAPRCDVYMNSTGKVARVGTDPKQLVPLLCDQLTTVVQWDSCVRGMLAAGMTEFYEVGPMKQLKSMMKRINQAMWSQTQNIDV